jgi:hypothetical protein
MAKGTAMSAPIAYLKTLIVRLTLAGWLPVSLADFLIRHGGLRHE